MLSCWEKYISSRNFISTIIILISIFTENSAVCAEKKFKLDIPSSAANIALKTLAHSTKHSLLFQSKDIEGTITNAISGYYSLAQALKLLLEGSALSSAITNTGMITIVTTPIFLKEHKQGALLNSENVTAMPTGLHQKKTLSVKKPEETEIITVTSTRRKTKIQQTAMSLEAYSGKELEEKGYNTIAQFADMIPGISVINVGPGFFRIIIRNIATSTQEGGSAVIATYFDDFAISTSNGTADIRLVDMERVEVLKGPQGTLYGRSAMGGIVRYISNKARTDVVEGGVNLYRASVTDGGNDFGGHAYLNLPLTDNLAVRMVSYSYQNSGFIDNDELGLNDFNEEDTTGGRIALHWDATDTTTLDLTYLNQSIDGAPNWVTTIRDPGDLDIAGDEGPNIPFNIHARNQVAGVKNELSSKNELFNIKLESQFDGFITTFLATNSKIESDYVFDQREYAGLTSGCACDQSPPNSAPRGSETDVIEFRIVSSGDGFLDWIVGAYYEDAESNYAQWIPYYGPDQIAFGFLPLTDGVVTIDTKGEQGSNEKALYGELGFSFTENTHLTVGYRRSDVEFSSVQTQASGIFDLALGAYLLNGMLYETQEDVNTYKFSLEHRISDDLFIYGTANSGYRRGGFNLPTITSEFSTYDSDKLWSYEAGVKSSWLEGRVVVNASIYSIDYTDIQLVVQSPVTFVRETQNVGEVAVSGIELSLEYQINDYLNISVAGAYSNPELQEDVPGGVSGKKGDRLPGSAKENYAVNVNWFQPLMGDWDIYANGSYKYVGERLNDFNIDLDVALPSYQLVDLRLGVRNDDKGYSIALYVKNAFDEAIPYYIDRQGPFFESVPTNRPRSVGINVAYSF